MLYTVEELLHRDLNYTKVSERCLHAPGMHILERNSNMWVYETVEAQSSRYRVGYIVPGDTIITWVEMYESRVAARAAVNYLNGGNGQ